MSRVLTERLSSRTFICLMAVSALAAVLLSCGSGDEGYGLFLSRSTLSGMAMYEDREYGSAGFTSNTYYKPIRGALVEVVDAMSGDVLASGYTGNWGEFSLAFIHLPFTRAYARVISSTSGDGVPDVQVRTGPGGALHAEAGGDVPLGPGGAHETFINAPVSGSGGAFNILDVMSAAGQFVNTVAGSMPPPLRAYWYRGSPGTYFNFIDSGIYVLSTSLDTDEYDDDVLWHEYGHFAADAFSIDNSPGGGHSFTDTDLDLRLSWSEGWSDYFQAAVKGWLLMEPDLMDILSLAPGAGPSYYVDTVPGGFNVSLEIAASSPSVYRYSSNEIAVAKALLDLDMDPLYGPRGVWGVFSNVGDYLLPQDQVTLEAFWDGWVALEGRSPAVNSVLSARSIYYMEDAYESGGDDWPNPLRLLGVNNAAGEVHYLYRDSSMTDTDYVAFNATSPGDYTVETFCMRNGADTYLEVLGTDGLSIMNSPSDDEFNTGTCIPDKFTQYASRVIANISTPGIYYAMVNSSSSAKAVAPPNFPYTGRYGTYTVRVSGP